MTSTRALTSTRAFIIAGLLAGVSLAGAPTQAQEAGRYGARVGNTYLPSSHDSNCVGVICSSLPVDPARPSQVLAPPPCDGLICGLTPYGMQRPYTAAEAAEAEKARAAAQARAQAQAEPAVPAPRRGRKARKARTATAAPRTPAPAEPEAAGR